MARRRRVRRAAILLQKFLRIGVLTNGTATRVRGLLLLAAGLAQGLKRTPLSL